MNTCHNLPCSLSAALCIEKKQSTNIFMKRDVSWVDSWWWSTCFHTVRHLSTASLIPSKLWEWHKSCHNRITVPCIHSHRHSQHTTYYIHYKVLHAFLTTCSEIFTPTIHRKYPLTELITQLSKLFTNPITSNLFRKSKNIEWMGHRQQQEPGVYIQCTHTHVHIHTCLHTCSHTYIPHYT